MGTDDFSFPTITDVPRFPASPSLWRVPSKVSSDSVHGVDPERGGDSCVLKSESYYQRNWFSSIGIDMKSTTDEEEKMDKLWENFNDELHRISSFDRKKGKDIVRLCERGGMESDSDVPDEAVELCCVQALKMSKSSGTMLSPRRPSLLMILKVVKKFFLVQNSHCPKRRTYSM